MGISRNTQESHRKTLDPINWHKVIITIASYGTVELSSRVTKLRLGA